MTFQPTCQHELGFQTFRDASRKVPDQGDHTLVVCEYAWRHTATGQGKGGQLATVYNRSLAIWCGQHMTADDGQAILQYWWHQCHLTNLTAWVFAMRDAHGSCLSCVVGIVISAPLDDT